MQLAIEIVDVGFSFGRVHENRVGGRNPAILLKIMSLYM
jgi:hypothetical protein